MEKEMKEFVDIVTTSLRDVHVRTNRVIRENTTEMIDAEIEPIVTPYGYIIATIRFVVDDGEDFYGPNF